MGLGKRSTRHETVAAAKVAVVSELWWDFTPGQRVMTSDGFPGVVAAVEDGPHAGNEAYIVTLDNGMGGGQYASSQLRPMPQAVAVVEVTAADDYPELGSILEDRPPLAHVVTGSLNKIAAEEGHLYSIPFAGLGVDEEALGTYLGQDTEKSDHSMFRDEGGATWSVHPSRLLDSPMHLKDECPGCKTAHLDPGNDHQEWDHEDPEDDPEDPRQGELAGMPQTDLGHCENCGNGGHKTEEHQDEPSDEDNYVVQHPQSGMWTAHTSPGLKSGQESGTFEHEEDAHHALHHMMHDEGYFPNVWVDSGGGPEPADAKHFESEKRWMPNIGGTGKATEGQEPPPEHTAIDRYTSPTQLRDHLMQNHGWGPYDFQKRHEYNVEDHAAQHDTSRCHESGCAYTGLGHEHDERVEPDTSGLEHEINTLLSDPHAHDLLEHGEHGPSVYSHKVANVGEMTPMTLGTDHKGETDYASRVQCPNCESDRALVSVDGATACQNCGFTKEAGTTICRGCHQRMIAPDDDEWPLCQACQTIDNKTASSEMKSPKFVPGDRVMDFRGDGATIHKVYPSDIPGKSHRVQVRWDDPDMNMTWDGKEHPEGAGDERAFYEHVFDFHPDYAKGMAQHVNDAMAGVEGEDFLKSNPHGPSVYSSKTFDPYSMLVVASTDPSFRWHITASWADVRNKAKRLRSEGKVRITSHQGGVTAAEVKGDHAVYETVLQSMPGKPDSVAMWQCGCKWSSYSWGRTGPYRKYEGRMCSHALATQYEIQSRGSYGREIQEDQKNPRWLKARTRVVVEYDKDNGKNVSRPAQPRKRDLNRRYKASSLVQDETPPLAQLLYQAAGTYDAGEMALALRVAGYEEPQAFIHLAYDEQEHDKKKKRKHHQPGSRGPGWPYGAWWHGFGSGYCTQCDGAGCGHCGGTGGEVGSAPDGDGDAAPGGDDGGGDSGDNGGMSSEASLIPPALTEMQFEANTWNMWGDGADPRVLEGDSPKVETNTIHRMPKDANPGSYGWASHADPEGWVRNGPFDLVGSLQSAHDYDGEMLFEAGKDDEGPTHAGVVLKAGDTGRILMLQRALDNGQDEKDPAAGTWEFPGGGREDGDQTSLHSAIREWEEEVGQPFPEGGHVHHVWQSPNGVYQGHVVVIPEESQVALHEGRVTTNPDDPDGDCCEQAAWWDPDHAKKNPALRPECKDTPWDHVKAAALETTLHEEPEAALPTTDGDLEDDEHHSWESDNPGNQVVGSVGEIVAAFQAKAAHLDPEGGSGGPDNNDIAAAARAHLAKVGMKTFTPGEQAQIINEGEHTVASNLDRLSLEGTHYQQLEEALAAGEEDDDLSWV